MGVMVDSKMAARENGTLVGHPIGRQLPTTLSPPVYPKPSISLKYFIAIIKRILVRVKSWRERYPHNTSTSIRFLMAKVFSKK